MVQDLVNMGRLTQEEAEKSPFAHKLSRALGVSQAHDPELQIFDLNSGDVLLMCSDGVHGVVEEGVLESVVRDFAPDGLASTAEKILSEVLERGGPDNASLVLVREL